MNKISEEIELVKLVNEDVLEMGGRTRDRDRDRDGERGRDSDRHRDTDHTSRFIEVEELSGEFLDIYNNNIVFDE